MCKITKPTSVLNISRVLMQSQNAINIYLHFIISCPGLKLKFSFVLMSDTLRRCPGVQGKPLDSLLTFEVSSCSSLPLMAAAQGCWHNGPSRWVAVGGTALQTVSQPDRHIRQLPWDDSSAPDLYTWSKLQCCTLLPWIHRSAVLESWNSAMLHVALLHTSAASLTMAYNKSCPSSGVVHIKGWIPPT